ncbi:MAG: GNAT family protein [Candidatus Dojkabacteria bacterium]|nr:MAG: GNAT family protein [Candidatus Dojkabacteria bacterium]
MPVFPKLKTKVKALTLEPLSKTHAEGLLIILNDSDIQKTLFRTPRIVQPEAFTKAIESMYGEKIKEITYILTLTENRKKTYIGYVKIKLIDWSNMSAYLSVAILNKSEFRGKGYSTACYDAFFDFLFSSFGFLKIYGRTYEENTPTIKLNFRTGFRFIGRQKHFLVKKGQQTQDALFFEKLNPNLETSYTNIHNEKLLPLYRELKKFTEDESVLSIEKLEQPVNLESELEKWTEKHGNYIPRFSYDSKKIASAISLNKSILRKVYETHSQELPLHWKEYLEHIAHSLEKKLQLLESIGSVKHEKYNLAYYNSHSNGRNGEGIAVTQIGDSALKTEKSFWDVSNAMAKVFKKYFGKDIRVIESPKASLPTFNLPQKVVEMPTIHHLSKDSQLFYATYAAIVVSQYLNAYCSGFPILSVPISTESRFFINDALSLASTLNQIPEKLGNTHPAILAVKKIHRFHIARIPKKILDSLSNQIVKDMFYQSVIGLKKNKFILSRAFDSLFIPTTLEHQFSIETILCCPLSAGEKEILSSVFLNRPLTYPFETILKIRQEIIAMTAPNK